MVSLEALAELQGLVERHGFSNELQPLLVEQVIYEVKTKGLRRKKMLVLEGRQRPNMRQGWRAFEEELQERVVKRLGPGTKSNPSFAMNVQTALAAGDPFEPIPDCIDVVTGDEEPIVHEGNQVILLDFWASWCGPCQQAMAHNEHLLRENGKRWGDRVRIVAVSLDKSPEIAARHAKKQGWTSMEMLHIGGSQAAKIDYGVSGIPHIVLVDTRGVIAYSGNPF